MRVRLVRRPGQAGTRDLVAQYGDRLICVRYRYDARRRRRYKTAEIIVEEAAWTPQPEPDTIVALRIGPDQELRRRLLAAGALWHPKLQVWALRHDQAEALGLADRVVAPLADLLT